MSLVSSRLALIDTYLIVQLSVNPPDALPMHSECQGILHQGCLYFRTMELALCPDDCRFLPVPFSSRMSILTHAQLPQPFEPPF